MGRTINVKAEECRARRNSGNGGNDGNAGKMIIDYVGDGGNDIQRLDSTVHGTLFSPRYSGVDQKDLQLGQEKMLRVCSKTWVSAITSLRAPAMSICKLPGRGQAVS